jgi:cytochrome c peroxidase
MIPARPATACLALLLWAACGEAHEGSGDTPTAESMRDPETEPAALRSRAAESFEALPAPVLPQSSRERRLFDLGRTLFFEPRLSTDSQVSCGTCHLSQFGGADGLATALGVDGRKNARNAPSVFNTRLQSSQQWDGERSSLADQAARMPLDPAVFGNRDEVAVLARLRAAGYQAQFEHAFPEAEPALSLANIGTAIASFEQTLGTPGRFDAFLDGDDAALDTRERAGLELFLDAGCADCHAGPGLGGTQLVKFGQVEPYEAATGSSALDLGRFNITQDAADRFVFKTPMLRNVAETAPYFHDGSVIGLPQAVRVMLRVQLGEIRPEHEVENLVAFLGALSGPAPEWFSPPQP